MLARTLARILALLVRGPGSEILLGDIEEAHYRGASDRELLWDVIRSLLSWYRPRAVLRRAGSEPTGRRPADAASRRGSRRLGWGAPGADVRMALRGLSRRPGFALVVVLTLGLGIGATTTIYTVVDRVLLRPLPFDGSEELVVLGNTFPDREWSDDAEDLQHLAGVSYLNLVEVRRRARSLRSVAAVEWASVLLPDRGEGPELGAMARVTEGFFDILGVNATLGRLFLPEDYGPGADQRVVLSHGEWVRRFGADPDVVGKTVETAGLSLEVVGVLPPEYRPPEVVAAPGTGFWMPLDPTHPRYEDRGRRSLLVLARLGPGVSVGQAREELRGLGEDLAREFPEGTVYPDGSHLGWGANTLHAQTVGGTSRVLVVFLAAAGLLLVVAVINAAHLFLVRGMDRIGELSVRRALGAHRWALARQLLMESSLLAVSGGGLGTLLAFGGVRAFVRFGPAGMPRMAEVGVDMRILIVTALTSLCAGMVTGLLPILRLGGADLARMLRFGESRSVAPVASRGRMVMVSAQLGVALVLTVSATLLFESFLRLRSVDPGFQPKGLVAFSMPMKRPGGPVQEAWQGWDALLQEVSAIPGVRVGGASNLPFQSPDWAPGVVLAGEGPETRRTGIAGYVITPGYLETIGVPIKAGRPFDGTDGPDAEAVVLVNEAFVRDVLRGGPALDQVLRLRGDDGGLAPVRVVGVVGDAVQTRAQDGMRPAVYLPYTQAEWPAIQVAVRGAAGDPGELAPSLRAAARAFSPDIPVRDISTMVTRMGATRAESRFQTSLLVVFALVAVLLAGVGLYGTLAHMVGRRTRELGIRMALGADEARILGLVLRQGSWLAGMGLGGGIGGALITVPLLKRFLFQVGPLHPPAFLLAVLALGVVALSAVLIPARRATRVDPVRAFQAE